MNTDELHDADPSLGSEIERLRHAYLAVAPRDGARDVAERAIAARPDLLPMRASGWRRRRIAAAGMLSLAAAAVAVVMVADRNSAAPIAPAPVAADSAASSIAVEVPDGRNAAVFATRNPLISVVWIY